MTTETLAVLFADRPGFVEPVAAALADLVSGAVTTNGGALMSGPAGGLTARFASAASAVTAAVAMQQASQRGTGRSAEAFPPMRVGISVGDVQVDGDDRADAPVMVAAGLCRMAEPGQILVADIVRMLCAGRRRHNFADAGPIAVEGLTGPVRAHSVIWNPGPLPGDIPLPPWLSRPLAAGFIGREAERDTIASALAQVTSGDGLRLVLITGEPGVGKTALLSAAAVAGFEQGAVVLYGRCDQALASPYQPFCEALDHYTVHLPDDVLYSHDRLRLGTLKRVLPGLARRCPDAVVPAETDPDADRYLFFGAVAGLLAGASARAPVVLALDDLHWADGPSLQLLRYLAQRSDPGRVLILATYRSTDVSHAHPLSETLVALRANPSVRRITLAGLSEAEVLAFIESASGRAMGASAGDLARILHRDTAGNPFFVGELLRHLEEMHADGPAEGHWGAAADLARVGLPDSVKEVVGARVRAMGGPAHEALRAAAVIGDQFDLDVLAGTLGRGDDEVLDLLEAAARIGVVVEDAQVPGRFRFAHALIRQTLMAELTATTQGRLHLHIANELERKGGVAPGELARHLFATRRQGELVKAVDLACDAGRQALAALAPEEAIRWYGLALEASAETGDPDRRARCLLGLGEAQRQAGNAAFRTTLLEAAGLARQSGDRDALVAAALANHRGIVSATGKVDDERVEVLQAALEAVGPADSADRARLLTRLAIELAFRGDQSGADAAAEALEVACRLGVRSVLMHVLSQRLIAIWTPDTLQQRLAETEEAQALARELDDAGHEFWASMNRVLCSMEAGRIEDADANLQRALVLADDIDHPLLHWQMSFTKSWRALLAGEPESAEAFANDALRIGSDSGQPDTMLIYGAAITSVRWHQGRLDEVVEMAAAGARQGRIPGLQASLAWILAESGRDSEARPLVDEAHSGGFRIPMDANWLAAMSQWSDVAARLAHHDAAAALYDLLLPYGSLVPVSGATVHDPVAHSLGVLATATGRFDLAERHFADGLALTETLRAPFFMARANLEWARMLLIRRGSGDLARALGLLHAAADIARTRGYRAIDRQVTALVERGRTME